MHFDISIAVWAGLGIYALYTGIKRWRQKNAANIYRYTKESVARFSKWYGILVSLIGIFLLWGVVLKLFWLPYILTLINVLCVVAAGIALFIAYKKVLVESPR